jgi:hypothetical protein
MAFRESVMKDIEGVCDRRSSQKGLDDEFHQAFAR